MINQERSKRIYTFRGVITLEGALHIGSGGGDDRTDATVVRDARGNPYIPGSSLRGAIRAAVLRYSPTILSDSFFVRDERALQQLEQAVNRMAREEDRVKHLTTSSQKLNAAERLFGTTIWASPLYIADLPPIQPDRREIGEIRHGVAIDRDTGAAADRLKYDFEVLPSGYSFQLHMRCEMDATYESDWSAMLALGLRLLELGELPLGGRAARGVGQIRLRNLVTYRLDMGDRAALRSALLSDPQQETRYGEMLPGSWATAVLRERQ